MRFQNPDLPAKRRAAGALVILVVCWSGIVTATATAATWSAPKKVDPSFSLTNTGSMLSCPSASFCAAVDVAGDAATYNGSSWTVQAGIDGAESLFAVSCVSETFCVGIDDRPSALIYDGSSWGAPTSIGGGRLFSVSCASAMFCVAVGSDAVIYDGHSWS